MALPNSLLFEAVEKYGRKFMFVYPKHEQITEGFFGEYITLGKRVKGYYGVCTACMTSSDVDVVWEKDNVKRFTTCPNCGTWVEQRKGWYGKRSLRDRFYLQAWEVHSADHVTLHEAIIALDDWENYDKRQGEPEIQNVYDLRSTDLTPGKCVTTRWNGVEMKSSGVCGDYERDGRYIKPFGGVMIDREAYMGFEKLENTFLRPFLKACESSPVLDLEEYAAYIIRMVEEPMTELLFKAGFTQLARDRVYQPRRTHGTTHMNFAERSPKRFFRGLKKNGAAEKMKQLMKIIYPPNVTESSLEFVARRLRDDPAEKPEDVRLLAEAGDEIYIFREIWDALPAFRSRRISEYIDRINDRNEHSVGYYRDYLRNAVACGAPLNEPKTAFPDDLTQAHDEMAAKRQYLIKKITKDKFRKAQEKLVEAGFEYEHNGIRAIVPLSPKELIDEGKALHHCVGGYVDGVAEGRTNIVFIRRKPDESWFTLEISPKTLKYCQCYGDHNKTSGIFYAKSSTAYNREVGKFLYHYKRHLTWEKKKKKEMKQLCRKTA